MNKQVSDQALASQVDKLSKEMEPQRDLWSGIERAIQGKSQHETMVSNKKSIVPIAWAASFIAAVLVAWISFTPTTLKLFMPLTTINEEVSPLDAGVLVTSMQESFQQQKKAMLVSYGQPDVTNLPAKMQTQLIELAQARKTIKKALLNDENNADLLNLLRFTQEQELNLLQQLYPYMNNKNIQWQTI